SHWASVMPSCMPGAVIRYAVARSRRTTAVCRKVFAVATASLGSGIGAPHARVFQAALPGRIECEAGGAAFDVFVREWMRAARPARNTTTARAENTVRTRGRS